MTKNTWIENHKTLIVGVVDGLSYFAWLFGLLLSRVLGSAAAIMAFKFFSATPETTVYQLSQFAHADNFWLGSFALAMAYSALYTTIHGTIGGHRSSFLPQGQIAQALKPTAQNSGK